MKRRDILVWAATIEGGYCWMWSRNGISIYLELPLRFWKFFFNPFLFYIRIFFSNIYMYVYILPLFLFYPLYKSIQYSHITWLTAAPPIACQFNNYSILCRYTSIMSSCKFLRKKMQCICYQNFSNWITIFILKGQTY